MLSSLKPIVFCALIGSLTVYLYYNTTHLLSSFLTMSSKASDWKSRAQSHPSPSTYTPSLAALALLAMRDTPVTQNSLTLALFTDKVAITASGDVVILTAEDYDAIIALREQVKALPSPDTFRNTWIIAQQITSRPIDILSLGTTEVMHQVGVQGYDGVKKELKETVGHITHLPDELHELMAIVLEARAGFSNESMNQEIVNKVKDIIPA